MQMFVRECTMIVKEKELTIFWSECYADFVL